MKGQWTCRRVTAGKKCGAINPTRRRKCVRCGKPRPARKRPAHMAVLDQPYSWWVYQFGEQCGICGALPTPGRRLDRDHDHKTGMARGLLCWRHNRALDCFSGTDELQAAVAYLERVPQPEVEAQV